MYHWQVYFVDQPCRLQNVMVFVIEKEPCCTLCSERNLFRSGVLSTDSSRDNDTLRARKPFKRKQSLSFSIQYHIEMLCHFWADSTSAECHITALMFVPSVRATFSSGRPAGRSCEATCCNC